METFAPAYFDYMSSAVVANVGCKGFHTYQYVADHSSATYPIGKDIRMLQDYFQEDSPTSGIITIEGDTDEPPCHGKSIL